MPSAVQTIFGVQLSILKLVQEDGHDDSGPGTRFLLEFLQGLPSEWGGLSGRGLTLRDDGAGLSHGRGIAFVWDGLQRRRSWVAVLGSTLGQHFPEVR